MPPRNLLFQFLRLPIQEVKMLRQSGDQFPHHSRQAILGIFQYRRLPEIE